MSLPSFYRIRLCAKHLGRQSSFMNLSVSRKPPVQLEAVTQRSTNSAALFVNTAVKATRYIVTIMCYTLYFGVSYLNEKISIFCVVVLNFHV